MGLRFGREESTRFRVDGSLLASDLRHAGEQPGVEQRPRKSSGARVLILSV